MAELFPTIAGIDHAPVGADKGGLIGAPFFGQDHRRSLRHG